MNRLVDSFNRRHTYLRISLTDRCNLRCRYCMPPEGIQSRPKEELLSFDEIETLAGVLVDLGIRKIRLTGGEPLVRRGVEDLCARLSAIPGLETLAVSTNGILLEEKADALLGAGVRQVNISLDTHRPDRFQQVALRPGHDSVLRGIAAAIGAGFDSVKINTVVMKGFNDDELLEFVGFAVKLSLNVRFIEYMPFLGNAWDSVRFLSYEQMREIIGSRYRLVPVVDDSPIPGPATSFRVEGSDAVIGFITTMSQHFCHACNRLRLTADGKLRTCLFAHDEVDLKTLLRDGAGHVGIEQAIQAALSLKWEQHPDADGLLALQDKAMVAIGG
jgi:cyclic pyranopterin phosphate synthase